MSLERDITFSDFLVPKIILCQKIINKTGMTKNQENSVYHFGDNYLTNHFAEFLQDRTKP